MSATAPDPVLDALVRAAVDATGAAQGWLVALAGDDLHVVAAVGGDPAALLGQTVPADSGTAGFVVGSGQPLAMAPSGGDERFAEGVAVLLGRRPTSVLSVPCLADDAVSGALELVDKSGGPFSFDDVEVVTLLAGVAGAAIEAGTGPGSVPSPGELMAGLERLASADPARYAAVASVIEALLGQA